LLLFYGRQFDDRFSQKPPFMRGDLNDREYGRTGGSPSGR